MFISRANSQVGISTGTVGASAPRIGCIDKSDIFRLRMLLEQSQDRVIELAILLREADHRIKNSLQIAASVMQAEARRADSVDVHDALMCAASRIQAISTVHDTLQATSGESVVEVGQLMEMMCHSMQDLCDGKAELICHEADASLMVPVTFARTLTILVNELIVNALRHAFSCDSLGKIFVSLKQVGDDIQVMVQDDGVGVETTPSSHTGFGTDLINMMVRQIGGKLVSQGTSGSCFTLTAPLPINPNPVKAGTPPMPFA